MSKRWSEMVSRTPSPTEDEVAVKDEYDRETVRTPSPALSKESENDCNNGQSNENFNTNMRKRKCSSASSSSSDSKKPLTKIETDPLVLARRQKDIDYGKNTIGYDNYTKEVSKLDRSDMHPKTPPMYKKMSRRNWDATVKKWRISLHHWDPEELKKLANLRKTENENKPTDSDEKVNIKIESESVEELQENSKMILDPIKLENDLDVKV